MQEIQFRASEDKLLEELMKRRKSHKLLGALHCPCDKCGSYNYVLCDFTTSSSECEACWAKRRYIEIVDGKE